MNNKIRVAYLGRVSTMQRSQESSLVNQRDVIVNFILSQKNEEFDPLSDCYEDKVSGVKLVKGNNNQKGFDALMKALNVSIIETNSSDKIELSYVIDKTKKPLYDKIYCKSTSRLTRSGARGENLIELLTQNGVEIYFYDLHKSTKDMSLIEQRIFNFLDNQYSRNMSYNTRANKILKTNNNELMLNGERFGWDLVREGTKRYYVKNEREYEILKLIIKLYLEEDLGFALIEQKLIDLGIENEKPKLTKSFINQMLKNPHYIGREKYYMYDENYINQFMLPKGYLKQYNFEWRDCPFIEPLITLEEWELIQDKMQSKANMGRGYKAPSNELSKLLKCGCCGKNFYSKGKVGEYQTFKCSSTRTPISRGGKQCGNHTLYIDDFFNSWLDDQTKQLRHRMTNICASSITSLYSLKHHLALLIAPNSPLINGDYIYDLYDEMDTLKGQLKQKIAILLETSTSETIDIIKEFQEDITKRMKEVQEKIDNYEDKENLIRDLIRQISIIESEIDNLNDNQNDTYSKEDYLQEVATITIYPIPTPKMKRNSVHLVSKLRIEEKINNLITSLVTSPIIDLLPKDTITQNQEKEYIIKEFPSDDLPTTFEILKELEQ